MKLIDKSKIEREKRLEQEREIDRGIKLAKRVDEIRAKKVVEEENLKKWRDETLKIVQEEINAKIAERDRLIQETKEAEEARFAVEAPLDVQKERARNAKQAKANDDTVKHLLSRETSLIARESSLEVKQMELLERDIQLRADEELTQRFLHERKTEYDEAQTLKNRARELKEQAERDIQRRYKELTDREETISFLERNVANEREAIEREKMDIADEKLHIQSQQETLKAAWQAYHKLQTKK